jgi:hypothetical protein
MASSNTREPADAVIQSRLIKMQQAGKSLDKPGAIWLVKHATPSDLRDLAALIERVAETPVTK